MMPASMESCVDFLAANPDFAACQGRMAAFRIPAPGRGQVN